MIELAILTKLCIVICIWMELAYVWTMCMDGTCLCMNNVYGWNWCDMWYETYVLDMWYGNISIYVIYICCENCWIEKNRKKRQYAGSLPSATDGKGLFAISSGRQRGHVAGNCASGRLTNLVSLPTVADGKGFAVRSGRQRPAVNHLTE